MPAGAPRRADDDFDAYGLTAPDPDERFRRALTANEDLADAFGRAWPLLEPTDLVGDLWSVPAYLRMCAPWLEREQVLALQREDASAWTVSDLPLLDAARRRLGDPEASRRRARQEGRRRRRPRADGRRRRRPHRDRRLRDAGDVDAARPGPDRGAGRRGCRAGHRPRPARRAVRARRRRRGAGADRRRVADAAGPLPLAQPDDRRGPGPGPARVHARPGRSVSRGSGSTGSPWPRSTSTTAPRRRSWPRPSP